jgi:phage terminase large subunit-like protein
MVEGLSGILAVSPPWFRPVFEPSRRRVVWPNGAIAMLFSAEEPDRLRGPNFDAAWCDELAAWNHAEETWTNLQLGLRLGVRPQNVVTTTPRPTALVRRLLAAPDTVITRSTTYANAAHLAPSFLEAIRRS